MRKKQWNYQEKLEISIVAVLLVLILLFWLIPRIELLPTKLPSISFQRIQMIQIPRTIQKVQQKSPPPARPSIPVPGDDLEMLTEIPLKASSKISAKGQSTANTPLSEEDLPYPPRQTIEVLPKVDDLKVKGEIVIRLLIGTNGKMKDYTIVSNTTDNPLCLKRVLNAARKSRWEIIHLDNNKVEYWITKRYQFK